MMKEAFGAVAAVASLMVVTLGLAWGAAALQDRYPHVEIDVATADCLETHANEILKLRSRVSALESQLADLQAATQLPVSETRSAPSGKTPSALPEASSSKIETITP